MDDAIASLVLIGMTLFAIGMWRDAQRLERELVALKAQQAQQGGPEPSPEPPFRKPKASNAPRLPAKPSDTPRQPWRRSAGRRRPRTVEWV